MGRKLKTVCWVEGVDLYPVRIGFAPSERSWNRLMKEVGCNAPYPTTHGATTKIEANGKNPIVVVTIADGVENTRPAREIEALMVHECTHVMQNVFDLVGENEPGAETQAYLTQYVWGAMMFIWDETRGQRK